MRLIIYTQIVDKDDPILGFFHGWILEFSKHFDRIDVLCLKQGRYHFPPHVFVQSLGKETSGSHAQYFFRFYRFFYRNYVRSHADYVFFHMGAIANVLAFPFFILRKRRKTAFYWWKTYGHLNLLERLALMLCDRVYTAVRESFPIDTAKRHIVGHAIDTERFIPRDEKAENEILFVGRLSRVKRVEQVLRVARKLADRRPFLSVRIVGAVADAAYERELRALVDALELPGVVQFVAGLHHEAVAGEYQRALVLMNPSDTDGLDKVVLEAMACGVIPLTANLSFKDMLSPHGLFMGKGDLDGYAKRIEEIMDMGSGERRLLAETLRNIVTREHDLKTLSHRLFEVK